MVVLPESGLKASNRSGAVFVFAGCANAQMIGWAVPFDEIVVKNPGWPCPPPIDEDEIANSNAGLGDVFTPHTLATAPPLLTTRPETVRRIYVVGLAAPAGANRVSAQHIILLRRVTSQTVFVHKIHVSVFACRHLQMCFGPG